MQRPPPAQIAHPAWQWLAGLCALMVFLAGGLAANPVWHEALHHHVENSATADDHHDGGDPSGAADEATCVVCAFAHQQVDTGWVSPVIGPVLGRLEWVDWNEPAALLLESVWPEPSGRGPPARV